MVEVFVHFRLFTEFSFEIGKFRQKKLRKTSDDKTRSDASFQKNCLIIGGKFPKIDPNIAKTENF